MTTVKTAYQQKITAGLLQPDADQARVIELLSTLGEKITQTRQTFIDRLIKKTAAPKGYYFYGGVGRGKSMVMDLFFKEVTVSQKRRVHFHAFMLEVHDFLHEQRKRSAEERIDGDLIVFANKVAAETKLLCFDEFQVKDVADAMILGRLFTALFTRGVVVVITSNIKPDDLYLDGLQRDRFLPFIALLKQQLNVVAFVGDTDYRLGRLRNRQVYFWPHDTDANREADKIFLELADGLDPKPDTITVKERVINIPNAARETAVFDFADLCADSKSALDYLELLKRYNVFIIKNIPVLKDEQKNHVVRFITLIDTLYDHHARIVVTAAAAPEKLYQGEAYAEVFQRTQSRLLEMQSQGYCQ